MTGGMVFKDRILYMVNIRKLRRGILPGILVTVLLAGSNLVFMFRPGQIQPQREQREQAGKKYRSGGKRMHRIMHHFLK